MLRYEHEEPIRVWAEDGFELKLWATYQVRYGKDILAYQFTHNGKVIFEGNDFGCSPLHAIDSDESVAGCLSFLSLKPGDTDPEYFEDYTEEQLGWATQYGEEVSLYVAELEER